MLIRDVLKRTVPDPDSYEAVIQGLSSAGELGRVNRGPTGGPQATPENLAKVLIARMAGAGRRTATKAMRAYFDLPLLGKPEGRGRFGDALAGIFADPEWAKRILWVELCLDWHGGSIHDHRKFPLDDPLEPHRETIFLNEGDRERFDLWQSNGGFRTNCTVNGEVLQMMIAVMNGANESAPNIDPDTAGPENPKIHLVN